MERLNDIMMRTAQRRQRLPEERTAQTSGPQEQRPQPARRPLREQTARLGQQYPSQQHTPEHPLPPRAPDGQRETPFQVQRTQYPGQRPPVTGPGAYQQRPRPIQEPQRPPVWTGRVISTDPKVAYQPAVQADVNEDWEDDATGMRYGDWEDNGYDAQAHIRPPLPAGRQVAASMQGSNYVSSVREVSAHQYPEARSTITRNLRDGRMPQAQPPVPQALPQEIRPYHRATQPLNPQAIQEMGQGTAQEASSIQKPARQMVVRDPSALLAASTPTSTCPVCKGAGYLRANVPYGHPNFGKPIACECKEAERKEKRRQQLRDISNLGAFSNASFKNFNPNVSPSVKRAYQVALDYAEDPYGWLLLIGKNGCGKTHLAAAIANRHLARGSLVLFTVVTELLDHLRATFAPNSTEVYDQLFARMREAELLVLDDLGAQQSSPWANEKLFQLLNYRYNSRFPTIITTNNLGLQGIEDRVRSRLVDAALVTTVTFDGAQDYRPHNPRRD